VYGKNVANSMDNEATSVAEAHGGHLGTKDDVKTILTHTNAFSLTKWAKYTLCIIFLQVLTLGSGCV
jgi:hypothetical protein